ncbi:TetR family transcriptional regulator C-terminal domain-containing protein [Bacillus sp. A31]|uniref:TetR family transcriptional regulator C-terminal domain-containing protein n=2 Tax=Bacillaceae TaxID=186817 RepID=UPI0039B46493
MSFTDIIRHSSSVKQAIREIFNFVIQSADSAAFPTGCLTVNSAVELSLIDQDINHMVTKMFKTTEMMFEKVLLDGQKNGELKEELDPHITSKLLHINLVGLRVMVKTNYTKEKK